MKNLSFIWILAAVLSITISGLVFADDVDWYRMTMDQIDISRDGGRTWVNIHSGAKEFNFQDLAGGSPTQFSNKRIPVGTYNKWKVHVIAHDVQVSDADAIGGATALEQGTGSDWETGDMRVTIDAGGNTNATWSFDVTNSYTVLAVDAIDLDPQITIE